MSSSRSKKEWKAHIEPHLSTSLQAVSDAITRTDEVQAWLRDASTAAAERLGSAGGMQGEMQGYVRMMNDLENRFPALLDAVDDLTEGCGQVDLHWRPTNPNLSRVQVAFDRNFTVDLFVRLDARTPEAVQEVIGTVADALPDGTPYPNRPNTVTGLVGHDGVCVGVRVREHLSEDRQGQYRTVTLLPDNQDDLENLSEKEAASHLLQMLASPDSSSGA